MGINRFLAIISTTPNRFAGLGIPIGPFSKIENNAVYAKGFVLELTTPSSECTAISSERDFGIEKNPCSSDYGANISEAEEFE